MTIFISTLFILVTFEVFPVSLYYIYDTLVRQDHSVWLHRAALHNSRARGRVPSSMERMPLGIVQGGDIGVLNAYKLPHKVLTTILTLR